MDITAIANTLFRLIYHNCTTLIGVLQINLFGIFVILTMV